MINRRGLILLYPLLAAVFGPSVLLLRSQWAGWLLGLIAGVGIILLFVKNFPRLVVYKNIYIEAQVVGLILGGGVFLFPSFRPLLVFLWMIVVFSRYYNSGKLICEYLSSKKES